MFLPLWTPLPISTLYAITSRHYPNQCRSPAVEVQFSYPSPSSWSHLGAGRKQFGFEVLVRQPNNTSGGGVLRTALRAATIMVCLEAQGEYGKLNNEEKGRTKHPSMVNDRRWKMKGKKKKKKKKKCNLRVIFSFAF